MSGLTPDGLFLFHKIKDKKQLKKHQKEEKKNNLKDFEQTDIFNNIKKSFPDAELIDVKDNKDD